MWGEAGLGGIRRPEAGAHPPPLFAGAARSAFDSLCTVEKYEIVASSPAARSRVATRPTAWYASASPRPCTSQLASSAS